MNRTHISYLLGYLKHVTRTLQSAYTLRRIHASVRMCMCARREYRSHGYAYRVWDDVAVCSCLFSHHLEVGAALCGVPYLRSIWRL